jgi:hypothetical protein
VAEPEPARQVDHQRQAGARLRAGRAAQRLALGGEVDDTPISPISPIRTVPSMPSSASATIWSAMSSTESARPRRACEV